MDFPVPGKHKPSFLVISLPTVASHDPMGYESPSVSTAVPEVKIPESTHFSTAHRTQQGLVVPFSAF
jgi:hypothetical protein